MRLTAFLAASARYCRPPSKLQPTRDAHYWTPPAQIRTCGLPAYGSYLGCLTAKRMFGQGCRIRGLGSHSSASWAIRSHVVRSFWLRRRSVRPHKNPDVVSEGRECPAVGRHGVVVEETSHDLLQPFSLFGDWPVHASSHFLLHSRSFAIIRSRRVFLIIRKRPFRDLLQMKVKPRKLKVSG